MTMALIYWVMMLLWLVSLFGGSYVVGPHYAPHVSSVFAFILFVLLGWKVFGRPISDA